MNYLRTEAENDPPTHPKTLTPQANCATYPSPMSGPLESDKHCNLSDNPGRLGGLTPILEISLDGRSVDLQTTRQYRRLRSGIGDSTRRLARRAGDVGPRPR